MQGASQHAAVGGGKYFFFVDVEVRDQCARRVTGEADFNLIFVHGFLSVVQNFR
jgi:hypothetical protein